MGFAGFAEIEHFIDDRHELGLVCKSCRKVGKDLSLKFVDEVSLVII